MFPVLRGFYTGESLLGGVHSAGHGLQGIEDVICLPI
jgi:hypothetical protein